VSPDFLAGAFVAFTGGFIGCAIALLILNREVWLRINLLEKCVDALLKSRIAEFEEQEQKRA
jgi:hypothetical protein